MTKRKQWLFLPLLLLATTLAVADVTTPDERIAAQVAAFNGTPEAFEAYAQSGYSKRVLDQSTPEQRAAIVKRIQGDFGKITVKSVRRDARNRFKVGIIGSTGMAGTLELGLDTEAPFRVIGLGISVGGDDDSASLPPVPVNGSMDATQLAAALDPYLAKLTGDDLFSGVVLVARNGVPQFERGYGLASRTYSVPNTPAMRFDIGSIDKHLTKTAVGQLIAAGKLTPEDTIGKVLPDYPNADAKKATVAQLLEHRGGLADMFSADLRTQSRSRFRSNHDWYQYVAPKPVNFEPGTKKEYCNSCYIVLGEMIERVSGTPYERYVEQNVLQRAGMKNTGFFADDSIERNLATGYSTKLGPGIRSNIFAHGAAGNAAGGAFATAADLLALDEALRGGKLLDPQRTAWFFDDTKPATGRIDVPRNYSGGTAGVNASVASGGTWTVVVLANIDPPAAEDLAVAISHALQDRG